MLIKHIYIFQGINEEYRTNMLALKNFVLVKFLNDTTVIPNESSWFGFYTPGQDVEIQTLQESKLYTEVNHFKSF